MSQINYPSSILVVLNASNTATLSGDSILMTDDGNNYTNTINKDSVILLNTDNNKVQMLCAASAGITNSTTTILADKINMGDGSLKMTYKPSGIETFNGQVLDITTNDSMTLQGLTSTEGQVVTANASGKPIWATPTGGGGSWVGNATSQLNMNAFDITSLGIDDANMTLSPNVLTLKNSLDPDNVGSAKLGNDYLQYLNKIDGNITSQANYASSGITLDNTADTTGLGLNLLSMREYSTQNNMNLTPNSFRIERPQHDNDGVQTFSLFQPNDTACVNYTDALNSTQCVISSLGIINSGVVAGNYVHDISHYSRNDMKLTTNDGLLEINSNYINFAGASGNWGLNPTGLNMLDVSGNQSFIGGGNLQIQAPTGEYIGISTINGIDINGNAGTEGQVLSKDVSNNLTWATPEPPVTIVNYFISQTNPIFQYPPQPPSSTIINTYGYYGWQFINAIPGRKISWYYPPNYDMEVQDVLGLYMNYFNVASTSNDELPFISIYTKPLGSGDIIPGFAHSSMTYIANFTPVVNSPYSSFMNITGVQPVPFAYGHQQVGMIQRPVASNPAGTYTPTMQVLAISVGTNSTSAVNSVNFVMSKVGVCVAGLNNESVLNPLDSTLVGSWVSTATSNLNMSSFSIDASANNLSIGTLTSTGLTLGKAATTTNIQGNLQINTSSGTTGQFLTSAGSGAPPTWTTGGGGWVGTATSDLTMGIYNISSAVLDNSGGLVTIGANTTGLTLGKEATTTNIHGNLQINASSGTSGQVLTSNGTTAEWATPTGGWVGVATSNLSMGNNKILVGDGTGLNVDISDNGFKLYNQSTLSVDIGFGSITTYRNGNPNKTAQLDSDVGLFCYNGLEARGIQISNTDIIVDNVAGSANQVLSKDASNILTWATPTGGGGGWVGTATSDLNMSSYNITSDSALSIGNTSVTTKLIGNVDISNNLTYANGALLIQGGTSVGTTAVSLNIGTAYPTRNTDFILILTGVTASRVLTFPTAVAGYKITIYNKSNQNWTMNSAAGDLFFGNGNDPPGGLLTYRNGIAPGKCLTFFQQSLSNYLINESVSTTETYIGKLYANNNANVPINILGNLENFSTSVTPYTLRTFADSCINTFLVCSGSASVVYLQTFATLASILTGYVIIIRNNTLLPITIQGNAFPAVIYATGSVDSAASFILPSTMTCSIKAISNRGYYVFSMY